MTNKNNGNGFNHDIEDDLIEEFEDDYIAVLNISGTEKFLEWIKTNVHSEIKLTDEEILDQIESIYIPSFIDEEDLDSFFEEFGEDIFTYMFALYSKNRNSFPAYKGVESLSEWFEVTVQDDIISIDSVLDYLDDLDEQ